MLWKFRGIELRRSHTINVLERVVKHRLWTKVEFSENQMSGRGTTDAILH